MTVTTSKPTPTTTTTHNNTAETTKTGLSERASGSGGTTEIFERYESNVRSYCRSFPVVFQRAKGAELFDESGRAYLDFFCGAGALNYGHNPDFIQERLINYLRGDNVSHALDMFTVAKRELLTRFVDIILKPRGLDYKVQFVGPTGADAVEAALKLARLATGRHTLASFTGGWHGMTTGCLQVTSDRDTRATAGAPLPFTTFLPYPAGPSNPRSASATLAALASTASAPTASAAAASLEARASLASTASLEAIEAVFADTHSGVEKPAAMIVETVQSEGGVYVAPIEWLRGLRSLCDRHNVLLIVDDVQVGCGRTGTFFSFERAGIEPDIVCLSKSIGGYGLPLSLVLMRRNLDIWKRAQHTGTFRGNQLAFIAASAALDYWKDDHFTQSIIKKGDLVRSTLTKAFAHNPSIEVRGLGMINGVDVNNPDLAAQASARCFNAGLIIERAGRNGTVLKIQPPLTIDETQLLTGCEILIKALAS